MSVDGMFLYHLANELDGTLKNGKIQKISQLSKADFLFLIRNNNKNHKLYISLSTAMARIHLSDENYNTSFQPGGFCMFLRKFIEQGTIEQIKTLNYDRVVEITINNLNEIGDETKLYLIIELFGRYANMIILDDSRKIINAFKHISPFEAIDRTIVNGVEYILPEDDKINPFAFDKVRSFFENASVTYQDIINNIRGISPLLANHIISTSNYNNKKMFDTYKNIITAEIKPTICYGTKNNFYFADIFDKNKKYYSNLSQLLNDYYREASSLDRVRQIHKYLHNFAKSQENKYKTKLEKLSKDMVKAKNNAIYRIKGDILLSNQNNIGKGASSFEGYSYELDKDVKIDLDRRLTIIQNANKYYTKYKKQKTAIGHIEEQTEITKKMLKYFEELVQQLDSTYELFDLEEIQDELLEKGFLHKQKRKKKRKILNYDEYIDDDGIRILVGKNNIQNNFLTHKYAQKNYWWFHVKNQTGSHVIVCSKDDLSETTIRTAANLSAYFSKSRDSQSVPVDYTLVKNIKKVPGEMGSYVTYTNQKTIYIDPSYELIEKLNKNIKRKA